MKKISLLLICVLILSLGCASGTQYLDPTKDTGSMEWGPREIKTTVGKMVGSMYDFLKKEWKKPTFIQVKKFRNRTSEHIDTRLVSDEIATNLIRRRIRFIDRSLTADALKEMEMGTSGLIDPDSAVPIGKLKSPNFYLTGDIRDNVRTVRGRRMQYIVVTMKLIQLKTGIPYWQDRQEFLKSTKKNKISF
jgi:uncharacterized protein (TIGR02722 family)